MMYEVARELKKHVICFPGRSRNVFILFREGFYCGLKCSGSFQRYREWSVRIRGFWVVHEWYSGEGFAVFIWFPECL